MNKLIWWINGKYLDSNEVKIPITDLSVIRGYGIFDFLRTYGGKPFLLAEHLRRLEKSADLLNLKSPYTQKQIQEVVLSLLSKNKLPEANIRLMLTGGESNDFITPSGNSILAILITPVAAYPNDYFEKGVKVVTIQAKRAVPKAKTINYLEAVMSSVEAKRRGAIETIYVDRDDNVLEATTSNIFAFYGNNLITPKEGILEGITRKLVIRLAQKDFKVLEQGIKFDKFLKADELFLTASNKEVMPVIKVNNYTIAEGKVGKNTQRIIELFSNYTKKYALK